MNDNLGGIVLSVMMLFVFGFAALTFASISSAAWTVGTIVSFGFAFLVLGLVLFGIVGVIRHGADPEAARQPRRISDPDQVGEAEGDDEAV